MRDEPATPVPLVAMQPGEGIAELLERAHGLSARETNWLYWFRAACNAAENSLCLKSKCGAVLVAPTLFFEKALFEGRLLSAGSNGPPRNDVAYRRCGETTPSKAHPKAGRTCCVHAEVRALLSIPRGTILGSTLYFARVDEKGVLLPSGRPWCTECSKLALDLGVKTWVLWHEAGPAEYDAAHYDWLSNRYDAWVPAAEDEKGMSK